MAPVERSTNETETFRGGWEFHFSFIRVNPARLTSLEWVVDTVITLSEMAADFESFYLDEYPKVYRACLAFTRSSDAALDATQEAFARAFARWGRLSKHPWAGGWVMTTAMNICRRRRAEPVSEKTHLITDHVERADVVAALRALPEKQRLAAVLYYIGDRPVVDIAEVMGISEGAVKSHLSRARDALRERLA